MSLSKDERVLALIERIFGEDTAKVFEVLLRRGKNVRDEEIAREIGMRVNSVRKALYQLHANQVVSYKKLYDPTTRWYIYLWSINEVGIKSLIERRIKLALNVLRQRLEHERSTVFFRCKKGSCPKISFDEALENSFRCPYCGGELEQVDNTEVIRRLEEEISKLERALSACHSR